MARYFLGASLEIAGSILSIYATAQLAAGLARFVGGSGDASGLWFWLWLDIGCAVAIAVGFWLMSAAKRILYYRMVAWSTYYYHSTLCRLVITDFENKNVRSLITKVAAGYTWQLSNIMQYMLDLIYGLLRFAAITVVVAQIAWWVIPLLAVFLLPSLVLENKLQSLQWFVWDQKGDHRHIFWGLEWLLRRVRAQMELRSLQSGTYVTEKLRRMNESFYTKQERTFRRASKRLLPAKVIEGVGTAAGAVYLLKQFLGGALSLHQYFFLSGALLRVGGALNAIFGSLNYMQEPLIFARDYFQLIDRQPKLIDKPDAHPLKTSGPPTIEFENVSFAYPGKDSVILDNVSFCIKPGEHVALVGENGAGKSTLIKLLLRFYRPTSGRILLEGKDLQDLAIETWYAHVASLFQDFNQYTLSVHENVSIGRADIAPNHEKILAAALKSNLDEVVSLYPHGYDTMLDSSFEKGIEPSGGQWQRVALARAFYRDAPVLILDEPTSAIDAKAEYDIFNNIFAHYQDRTAIIVSHRFSTVRRAHRIIVLDEGKIVEQGTHAELMKQYGLYHELFTKQAEGYKE
ncbi:ABC transporter ATP-binding protein [Candidatus Saccharibacteria bacterium]|nr:MAG: ABC transporter ATP-binding protein [Candidatus Saccharibacteria bacterium]